MKVAWYIQYPENECVGSPSRDGCVLQVSGICSSLTSEFSKGENEREREEGTQEVFKYSGGIYQFAWEIHED